MSIFENKNDLHCAIRADIASRNPISAVDLIDFAYLINIVNFIIDINEFTNSIQYHQFEKDKMRKLAVERQLDVIGQAANKISKEAQDILKNISWEKLTGLKNDLVYDGDEIPAERIWTISKNSIQEVLKEIEKIEEIKEYINSKRSFV
jgi:uncharacterized protein with HEPN domain